MPPMEDVTLTCVGCGDAFGTGGRFHTCLHVEAHGWQCLVDCGASAVTALRQRAIDLGEVGAVVLSHLHGDHFGGLPFLLLEACFVTPRETTLVVAGPPGVEERVMATLDLLFPGSAENVREAVPLAFVELAEREPTAIGPMQVTAFPVVHSRNLPCFAVRVELGGKAFAFSGDTEWTPALVEAARGTDLFVCECHQYDTPVPSHLTYRDLLAHRHELLTGRLVLTHLGPEMLARAGTLEIECAHDGLVIAI
jgi:ribonuclease BN (tRNA processing enzyme)